MTDVAGDRKAAIERYQRLGPVLGRLRQVLISIAFGLSYLFCSLLLTTLSSFYHGTGVIKPTPREHVAVADVGTCQQLGPVSSEGFGYRWRCNVVVRMDDGRTVNTVVGRSIVTPDDVGTPVDFREACFADRNTDCRYGQPVHWIWGALLKAVNLLGGFLKIFLVFVALVYLARAVVGVPRFFAFVDRRRRKKGVAHEPFSTGRRSAPPGKDINP